MLLAAVAHQAPRLLSQPAHRPRQVAIMSLAVQKQAAFFSATRRAVAPRAAARAVRVMAQLSQDELKKQVGGVMGVPAPRRRGRCGAQIGGTAGSGAATRLPPLLMWRCPHSG